jgi:tight adherence protein C
MLPAAWAAVVTAAAWRRRPAPARVRRLLLTRRQERAPARVAPSERVGAAVLRLARRPTDPVMARRAGAALLAAAPLLLVLPAAAPGAALAGWFWPTVRARREVRRRKAALAAGLPDVVDLFALAVGAGLTVPLAVAAVARRAQGPLGAELRRAVDEVTVGRRLADALDELPARTGDETRSLVAALVASERYGAPLAAGLERLADEVRRARRRRAEEAARRVPVKLLFPLVGCTLPAFALLTVAPLIAGAVRSLRL